MKRRKIFLPTVLIFLLSISGCEQSKPKSPLAWPGVTQQTRPWTRWWWHGSAVNKRDITASLEAYKKNGIGGLELTPIFGVIGEEDKFIDYLSPEWMEMLDFTLAEAKRLDLGIDMATGTGWPFGGPHVTAEYAPKNIVYKTYQLEAGKKLSERIHCKQTPLVRAVGNIVYQQYAANKSTAGDAWYDPTSLPEFRRIDIQDLVEPVSANKDLQGLALDQVKFEKELPLQTLMAYSQAGDALDLTHKVDQYGTLDWTASEGEWTLFAVFQGWHGKMVERAAPGGEGNTIDHFSEAAIAHYLNRFDEAFSGHDISNLRAFFNDSYEVDDARGQADWTPDLFAEFQQRRGYDLRHHLPALFGQATEEKNKRVLCDYRETISDLILEKFTMNWQKWAQEKGAIIRNQAHGSPANVLDLYAASDIPETEGRDILRIKYASSASHVTGKQLTSSESATWLNEHFKSTLADVKENIDRFLLGGVNHVFYHGTAYSPQDASWPGWLFYAAVHFNPRNSFWNDLGTLNEYITRVQSFLQSGKPNTDILLYFPIHDRFSEPGAELLEHVGGGRGGYDASAVKAVAENLQNAGYAFDYISDRQLSKAEITNSHVMAGGVSYKTIVVPQCSYMPLATLEKLVQLAQNGATVIMHKSLPGDVPGFGDLESRQTKFKQLLAKLDFKKSNGSELQTAIVGSGTVLVSDDLNQTLATTGIQREMLVDRELQFIRRSFDQGYYYFIANWSENAIDDWVPLATNAKSVAIFDPMSGKSGIAQSRLNENGQFQVYLQLAPGESRILKTFNSAVGGAAYAYCEPAGDAEQLNRTWQVDFIAGGPDKPESRQIVNLTSWTEWDGDAVKCFSGTAKYSISFPKPAGDVHGWALDLGRVAESARVSLNGKEIATLIGPTFRIIITGDLFKNENHLEIDVSNLMANRIIDLDKRHVLWKKFYNVNLPAHDIENRGPDNLFTAENWQPQPSGLIGPVTLTPVRKLDSF
ncbi:MAG: glycoside hydrolase family 2 protein [Deferribacteres bacterium]|nr:glycoside hydrolase family 2 protein [Deferribacteres bacterium]